MGFKRRFQQLMNKSATKAAKQELPELQHQHLHLHQQQHQQQLHQPQQQQMVVVQGGCSCCAVQLGRKGPIGYEMNIASSSTSSSSSNSSSSIGSYGGAQAGANRWRLPQPTNYFRFPEASFSIVELGDSGCGSSRVYEDIEPLYDHVAASPAAVAAAAAAAGGAPPLLHRSLPRHRSQRPADTDLRFRQLLVGSTRLDARGVKCTSF